MDPYDLFSCLLTGDQDGCENVKFVVCDLSL